LARFDNEVEYEEALRGAVVEIETQN